MHWQYSFLDPVDSSLLPASAMHMVSFCDSLHGAMLRSFSNDEPIVHWFVDMTNDGGITWRSFESPHYVSLNGIHWVDRMHATIVGHAGYIIHTADGGSTFKEQASNTLNELFAVCFGNLSAGTAVGLRGNIIRITTDEIVASSVHDRGAIGSPGLTINSLYPNPLTTSTTIAYHLPTSGLTSIGVYSLAGKAIVELAGEFQSTGDYSAHINCSRLSSGTYICRVTCNGLQAETELKIIR